MPKNNRGTHGALGKSKNRPLSLSTPPPKTPLKFEELQEAIELPPSVKNDIAKVVRSLEWKAKDQEAGFCMFRTMTGLTVLTMLGIPSTLIRGAMLFRAGPDQRRDMVAFCGPDNRSIACHPGSNVRPLLACLRSGSHRLHTRRLARRRSSFA